MDQTSDNLYIESITKPLYHVLKEWAVWEIMKGDEVNTNMQGHTVLLRHFPGTFKNIIPQKGNFDLGEYSLVLEISKHMLKYWAGVWMFM